MATDKNFVAINFIDCEENYKESLKYCLQAALMLLTGCRVLRICKY